MASEITVTFENGGIYRGFASSFTLDNEVTYYFSFDRDYRLQATNGNIVLQQYRNAGAWYDIDIITNFSVTEIAGGGTGDVTKQWVIDNFQPKGEYITANEADNRYQSKGNYITKKYGDSTYLLVAKIDEYFENYVTFEALANKLEMYVKRTGDTMTGPLKFPKVWQEVAGDTTISTNGDFSVIISNKTNGIAIYNDETVTNANYLTLNLAGIKNDFFTAGLFGDGTSNCILKLGEATENYYNILCAGGGSGRTETEIETTAAVHVNNSFWLDGELRIKEFEERAIAADVNDYYIIIHPKDAVKDDTIGYNFIEYNKDNLIKYYYQAGTTKYAHNNIVADTLIIATVANLVLNAGEYWSMFSSRSTFYDSDAGWIHNYLPDLKQLVNDKSTVKYLTEHNAQLEFLINNTSTIEGLTNNSEAIEATYNETFYSYSMLDALNDVINNIQDNLGTYFYSEFEPNTFTGGGKSRGGGVGRKQTTE